MSERLEIDMRKFLSAISLLIFIICSNAIASDNKEPLDSLFVYGDGFAFGVREPEGWTGDIQSAKELGVNIVFYRKTETVDNAKALIRITVSRKTDENTKSDLEYDMEGYKERYDNIKFKDIDISHPKYKAYPKLFFVPDTFFEYVVYINPGADAPQLLSASMNKQRKEATEEELEVFKKIVNSIVLIAKDFKVRN